MSTGPDTLAQSTASPPPASILAGFVEMAARELGLANIGHRSALHTLGPVDGPALVGAGFDLVRRNYDLVGASTNKDRSRETWRWHRPQPQIGADNRSPEVVIERAIVRAGLDLDRMDWSNQIPVASGLVSGAREGRNAIDLVRRVGERHFQLIELKIGHKTPLFAAIELLGYAYLWLLARNDRPSRPSALLDADQIDLRVVAPAVFYARYSLRPVEAALDTGVRALGDRHGVALSFRFDILDAAIRPDAIPAATELLALMDDPAPLHPCRSQCLERARRRTRPAPVRH